MVVEARPNLGCASVPVLGRKVGLYRPVPSVSAHTQGARLPIVELICTLPKTNLCDIVDHAPNKRGVVLSAGVKFDIYTSWWADS